MRYATALVCILAAVFAGACASTDRSEKGGSSRLAALKGMVYDFENRPVSDAEIGVDGRPAARSDINGRFALEGMSFGRYEVDVAKEGYETASISVDYGDAAQIVYVKMYSAKELLSLSEREADKRNWAEATACLDRIDAVDARDPAARYLRAVVSFRRGEAPRARTILEALLADGYDEPYVQLFLADILQYQLADAGGAEGHLAAYLASKYDPDVERRLLQLRARGK
jgi:hypothetical protein